MLVEKYSIILSVFFRSIVPNLELNLPNLETLILTNNNIEDLSEIDNLSTVKTLRTLCMIRNPLAALKYYRLYTIYKIPSLRVLDFKKVKDKVIFNFYLNLFFLIKFFSKKERQEAQKLFKGKKLKQSERPKTFIPGEQVDKSSFNYQSNQRFTQEQRVERAQPTKEDIEAIRVNS